MGLFSRETKVETVKAEPIDDLPPHVVQGESTIIAPPAPQAKDASVEEFVSKAPGATYFIDSSGNGNESLLCRQKPEGGQTCLKLAYDYAQLFKTMQSFDYFCAAPIHKVDAQYFECKKIGQ